MQINANNTKLDNCYLNNLALDLITENDHEAGYCLCSKCTCGQHICPRVIKTKAYPKSSLRSYYRQEYRKHPIAARPTHSASPIKPSLFKLESETTARREFTPYKIDYKPHQKITPEVPKLKFLSRSQYSQDFFDPGQVPVEKTRGAQARLHTGYHKFNAASTYSENFLRYELSPAKSYKPSETKNILLSASADEKVITTSRLNYIRHTYIPTGEFKPKDNTVTLLPFPTQYKTTSSLAFTETNDIPRIIRRARKAGDL
ncbi:unnamed protein product [Blepharisma stoltei]|uniref:Uncharacterized protein n=1 Tax=Blepharisma stoltei TaxID=1481888 RepID=A0AAU9IGZ3_9CILI|nr:unnamed protein product [Blepharisma stoltei]